VLAALQDLENELVALFAVLAEQRLDVLERRRLERLEAVALVDVADDAASRIRAPDVVGRKSRVPAGACRLLVCMVSITFAGRSQRPGLAAAARHGRSQACLASSM
jgi:hypothetical protein